MRLGEVFDQVEHKHMIVECFLQMWQHSVDLMFIMAVEDNGEFSLYDNNPASKNAIGIALDSDVHRVSLRTLFGDELAQALYLNYLNVIDARKPISIEQNYTQDDGTEVYFDTLFVPIFDNNGEAIFVCGVSRDVSKIKEAEQIAIQANEKLAEYSHALERMNQDLELKVRERTEELEQAKQLLESALEAKSSFVARMSHEIRTPIHAVIGLTHLALKTSLNNEQQDFLDKIHDSSQILLQLVNDVLDFSKIEAGKLGLEKVSFSLEKLVDRVINMNAYKAQEKKLELVYQISPQLPTLLAGDPLRIQQVLINLVSNAIKFTTEGSVLLHLYGERFDSAQLRLYCEIIDTGVGISLEQKDRLFQSFSQADDSITRQFGGTGLGLAISHQLCELMGGTIDVESEIGLGTKFIVSLPLQLPEDSEPSKEVKLFRFGKALIVDDHPLAREAIATLLNNENILTDTAESGFKALELIERSYQQEQPYDVVLMDWQMPVMNGIETTQKIRARYNPVTPPILMVSAYEKEQVQTYLDNGLVNHFLEKPVGKEALFQAVNLTLSDDNIPATTTSITPPDLSNYHLLLVDDNPINQQVALGYLSDTGIGVDTARNGLEALEMLRHHRYDLVLMDIQMPEMDGLTTSHYIRQHLALADLPIIAMTAYDTDTAKQESLTAGMNSHLGKPIDQALLFKTLQQYLLDTAATSTSDVNQTADTNSPIPEQLSRLEAINQLDVSKAISTMNLKPEAYLDLIYAFYQTYHELYAELITLNVTHDAERLLDEVHSLKSSAAYIGAFHLSDHCSTLQDALLQQQATDPLYVAICYDLEELLSQLTIYFTREETVKDESTHVNFSHKRYQAGLKQVLPLLDSSDFSAENHLLTLLRLTEQTKYASSVRSIIDQVEEIEFERAAAITRRLMTNE